MSWFIVVLGTLFMAPMVLMLMNASLGPSANTIEACKHYAREGYLHDSCFDEYGLIKRGCKSLDFPECHEREIAAIDALVFERNGPQVTDVSESERESFAEDFGCNYPKEGR